MYISVTSGAGLGAVEFGAPFPWAVPVTGAQMKLRRFHKRRSGMGDDSQQSQFGTKQVTGNLITGASTGVATAIQTGSKVAGGVAAGLMTAAAFDPEPISKAILAMAASFVGPLTALVNKGCGATCIQASKWADQAQAAAEDIKRQYWGTPTPRPRSLQQNALAALQSIFQALQSACSDPALGDAGRRCLSERLVEGGTAPWCPSGTGCDYWTAYYRPIEKDPNVVSDVGAIGDSVAQALGIGSGTDWLKFLLPAAIGVGALWLLE